MRAAARSIRARSLARRQDNGTYYSAQLTEHPDHSLELSILKHVSGVETALASSPNIGAYASRDGWFIRFQLEADTARTGVELSGPAADHVAGHGGRHVDLERGRRLGALDQLLVKGAADCEVLALLGPDTPAAPCTLSYASISRPSAVRARTASITSTGLARANVEMRSGPSPLLAGRFQYPGRVQFYVFNLSGGLGAGAAYAANSLGQLQRGRWYQFVGVADPGDLRDLSAGTSIYKDGQLVEGPPTQTVLDNFYKLTPGNGGAPLRFADTLQE